MSRRLWFLFCVALLLVLLAPAAPADEAADADANARAAAEAKARAFDRDRLIQTSRRAVGDGAGPDPFDAMQRSLEDDHAFMMGYDPKDAEEAALLVEFEKTVAERILLVGWPGDGAGTPAKDGALQESRRLDAWLAGKAACGVLVRDVGREVGAAREYGWDPDGTSPQVAPVVDAEGPVEVAPPGPPPAPGEAEAVPAEVPAGGEEAPVTPPEPQKPPETPAPPVEPLSLDEWAEQVVEQHENRTLQRKIVSTAVCGVADALQRANRQTPVYVHPDVRRLRRHAIVSNDVFSYNAPYAALRLLQADEREQSMQEDRPPPSLVDESMVRGKAKRMDTFQRDLAKRRKQREGVVQSLDQMVADLDGWKMQAALLAQEIEERQRALVPPEVEEPASEGAPDEKPTNQTPEGEDVEPELPPAPLALRLAEARESLVSLDITLLYMTAVRANERLKLLDRLIRATEGEAQSAEQALTGYEVALLKLRGARRLDRLYSDERRLRLWISKLEETKPEPGTIYASRLAAYQAVLAVLEVVQDAVVRQRELAPGGARLSEDSSPPPKPPESPGSPEDAKKARAEKATNPLAAILLNPEQATWDTKYVELATRELLNPEVAGVFDARLVARHHAAVDDRIRALLRARERSQEEAELRTRYDAAVAAAQTALAPLGDRDFAITNPQRKLPSLLATANEDFDVAMKGIAEQGKRNRERLEALLQYRTLLREQGTRSLLIRTDRDLTDEDVRQAIGDTSFALDKALRWVTFKDTDHAGGFLAGSWLRLLALLATAVGAVFAVRWLRHRIDGWIELKAATNPALRAAGASMREEQEEAKRRRVEEQAAPALTAADVLQTVVEEDVAEDVAEQDEQDEKDEPGGMPRKTVLPPAEDPPRKPADPPAGDARGAR